MLARIITVDRDFRGLNEPGDGTATDADMTTQADRDWWNAVWESYAGTLLFAMDSSLECFAHSLNALGWLLNPADFLDITDETKLRLATPAKLFGPPTKEQPYLFAHAGCLKCFPRICEHWSASRSLLAPIIEYHDATKHRHSVVVGQAWGGHAGVTGGHFLKPAPKQAMGGVVFAGSMEARNPDHTL